MKQKNPPSKGKPFSFNLLPVYAHKSQDKSIFLQLKELISRAIRDNELKPGEQLPSIRKISQITGLNPLTINKATKELLNEGWLVKRIGEGLYVNPKIGSHRPFADRSGKKRIVLVHTGGIRILSPENSYSFSIYHEACKLGKRLVVYPVSSKEDEIDTLLSIKDEDMVGVILYSILDLKTNRSLKALVDWGIPVVLIDRPVPGIDSLPQILVDHVGVVNSAMSYLLERGYQNYFYITPKISKGNEATRIRCRAFIDFLRNHDAGNPEDRIIEVTSHSHACLEKLIRQRCLSSKGTFAVLTCYDELALITLDVMKKLQLSIPNEVGLVGINDNIESGYPTNNLTTVHIDFTQMGVLAVNSLMEVSRSPASSLSKEVVFVPHYLVKRGTA